MLDDSVRVGMVAAMFSNLAALVGLSDSAVCEFRSRLHLRCGGAAIFIMEGKQNVRPIRIGLSPRNDSAVQAREQCPRLGEFEKDNNTFTRGLGVVALGRIIMYVDDMQVLITSSNRNDRKGHSGYRNRIGLPRKSCECLF